MDSPAGRSRKRRGSISREDIVLAAVRSLKDQSFERLTIRSIAAEMNTAPMSLYRHVSSKDDLLDAVVDFLFSRRWRPRVARTDWKAWTKEAAERFRDFLLNEPSALYVYLRQPVVSKTAMLRMETMLQVLFDAGFDTDTALRAFGTIHTYTIGFAALEASRARFAQSGVLAGDTAVKLATFTTKRQFSDGLEYLLEGIDGARP